MADLARQIDNYLRKKGSPLAGYGRTFVQAGQKYGVDPRVIVAISGGESSFGKYGPAQRIHNAWGWGPHIPFGSWEQGINAVTKGLASGYIGQGLDTFGEIQRKWAPLGAGNDPTNLNSNWLRTNSQFARELGLNPNKSLAYGAQGGQAAPAVGASPISGQPATGVPSTGATPSDIPNPAGALDLNRIFGIMNAQGKRALQGQMPSPNYVREMLKLVGQGTPRAGTTLTARGVGRKATTTGQVTREAGMGVVRGAIPGSPVPGQRPSASTHPTAGLSGYPAFDYMAPAGTTTVAPVSGTVIRLSGKDPKAGGPPGGALGYSVYLKGDDGKTYFMTHIDKVSVKAGQRVKQGQQIAVVANGPPSWSSPHVHMGVSG